MVHDRQSGREPNTSLKMCKADGKMDMILELLDE